MAARRSSSASVPRPTRWPAAALVVVTLALVAGCGGSGSSGGSGRSGGSGGSDGSALDGSAADGAAPSSAGSGDPTVSESPPAAADQVALRRFDGEPVTLADYRGRPLVVNFFASWCAPCIKEMPEFERVHQELGDEVAFLGVNVRDRVEDGRRLADQTGVTFDLVRDPGGDLLVAVGGNAMPTTAFVTAEGRLALVQSRSYRADTLRAAIDEVLLAPSATTRGPDPSAVSR